ncbi:hypothetical protein ACJX0J_028446, partial [Zea mays]
MIISIFSILLYQHYMDLLWIEFLLYNGNGEEFVFLELLCFQIVLNQNGDHAKSISAMSWQIVFL